MRAANKQQGTELARYRNSERDEVIVIGIDGDMEDPTARADWFYLASRKDLGREMGHEQLTGAQIATKVAEANGRGDVVIVFDEKRDGEDVRYEASAQERRWHDGAAGAMIALPRTIAEAGMSVETARAQMREALEQMSHWAAGRVFYYERRDGRRDEKTTERRAGYTGSSPAAAGVLRAAGIVNDDGGPGAGWVESRIESV